MFNEFTDRLDTVTQTWLVQVIRNLAEVGLMIKVDHWIPKKGNRKIVMDELHVVGIRGEEYKKLNLCRMSQWIIYTD